jgi:hypothetical protein
MPRKQRASVLPVSNEKSLTVVKNVQPTNTASLGQIVKEGMAFGVGNAVAHNAINRLFGTSNTVVPVKTEYAKCMQETNDKEYCAKYDLE